MQHGRTLLDIGGQHEESGDGRHGDVGSSVGSSVGYGVAVAVGSGVPVAVGSGVPVAVGSGVEVGAIYGVFVGSGVLVGTGAGIGATVGQNTGVLVGLVSLGAGVQVGGHVGCGVQVGRGVQVGVGGPVAAGWGVDACVSRYDLSSEITMYAPKPRTHTTARPKTASIAICCLVMVHLRKGNTMSTFPSHHYTTLGLSFQRPFEPYQPNSASSHSQQYNQPQQGEGCDDARFPTGLQRPTE
jgi:hypothetical protein